MPQKIESMLNYLSNQKLATLDRSKLSDYSINAFNKIPTTYYLKDTRKSQKIGYCLTIKYSWKP